jgi:predicted phage terminase large subunit-like protein
MTQTMNSFNPNDDTVQKLLDDADARVAAIRQSHLLFFHVYFSHYVEYETAPFQKEIFTMTEHDDTLDVIIAFRDSGKSSIVTMSYPLWAIMGKQEKKFILIFSQTQEKARQHLRNIKSELENDELLRKDLGPFQKETNQWGVGALAIPRFGAKIMAGSVKQSMRGLRHRNHRPDCVILDDIEDTQSVKTQEGRDKTWNWFTGEVIPGADQAAHIIAVGNLLHQDALLKRVEKEIKEGDASGNYAEYPIVDNNGKPLWPGKYSDQEAVQAERDQVMDEVAWHREYLLEIIPDDGQVIQSEWIKRYDGLPDTSSRKSLIGIDPAISQEDHADYTAMVPMRIFKKDGEYWFYVLPHLVNDKLTYRDTIDRAMSLSQAVGVNGNAKLYVEDVAYQRALAEELNNKRKIRAEAVNIGGSDKRARLKNVSHLIEDGRVLFPVTDTANILINQLTGLGTEKHDDLVDALTLTLRKAMKMMQKQSRGAMRGRIDKIGSRTKKDLPNWLNSRQRHLIKQGKKSIGYFRDEQ